MKTKEKKVMEYEDSPSGFVTLYNYKEPFMKYEKGYGFQGVLLFDGETDKVQCHLCGEWYIALSNHLIKEHAMRADQYKEEVGLIKNTALIGENLRAKLIAQGLDKRLQNLRSRKGVKHTPESRKMISNSLKENRREKQNMNGTCPEQLIDRLIKEYQKNGYKTPSIKKIQFAEALYKTYGTYKNACEIAGIPYNDPLESLKRGREKLIIQKNESLAKAQEWITQYYITHKKLPTLQETKNLSGRKRISKSLFYDLSKLAVVNAGFYEKSLAGEFQFSKEELLGFLKNFEKINNRKPSYSDARRGLIPNLSRYSYHFGSWKNALKLIS